MLDSRRTKSQREKQQVVPVPTCRTQHPGRRERARVTAQRPRALHQLPPGDKWLRGHGAREAQRKEKWEN